MDGVVAMQDGPEDRSSNGPESLPKPPGSLALLDQQEEAQCKLPVTLCAVDIVP